MIKYTDNKSSGFTIIETLVAITVLMIAVAGPLVVASKGLSAALYARDQITASYLAQESMEVIKGERDNLMVDESYVGDWSSTIALCSSATASISCDASSISMGTNFRSDGPSGGYPIYFSDSSGYVNFDDDGSNSPTIFKRYYYMTAPNSSSPCVSGLSECTAHVVVTWNEGTVPYEVNLDSEMVDIVR